MAGRVSGLWSVHSPKEANTALSGPLGQTHDDTFSILGYHFTLDGDQASKLLFYVTVSPRIFVPGLELPGGRFLPATLQMK